MSKKTTLRSSDLGEGLRTGTTGFTVRKRTGVGKVVHFFLLIAMVVIGASMLVYYQSPEGCMLAVVVGAVFGLVAINFEKLKTTKESLEFMSALFSSALGRGYQFCCMVKANGDVVFFNRPFQSVFPAFITQPSRTLETLLTLYHVPQDQRDLLAAHLSANNEGSLTLSLRAADETAAKTMTVLVEPIERPTGFMLLRGK
ncbi:MAG: hypothetical protein V4735_01550 [Pseudomonadota bacterium]